MRKVAFFFLFLKKKYVIIIMTHELVIPYNKSNILPFIRILSGMYKLNETHIKVLTTIIYFCKQNNTVVITPEIKRQVTHTLKISNIYVHLKFFKEKRIITYDNTGKDLVLLEPFIFPITEEDLQLTFTFKRYEQKSRETIHD